MTLCYDIEGDNLLFDITQIWCVCLKELGTGNRWEFFDKDELISFLIKNKPKEMVAHNGIGFDLPALRKLWGIDYTIGITQDEDSLLGFPCIHTDTLLLSKLLNRDRQGGHSLEAWGVRLGFPKEVYSDWSKFTHKMLVYCHRDVLVLEQVYLALLKEMGG